MPIHDHTPMEWTIKVRRVLIALRDAVKHTPGGSRFSTSGRPIKPMGIGLAAEVTRRSEDYLQNALNDTHQLQLEDFILLLQADMDLSPLDELERSLGRVAFKLPDAADHPDLASALLELGKEFGDTFEALSRALHSHSDGGCAITAREFRAFDR